MIGDSDNHNILQKQCSVAVPLVLDVPGRLAVHEIDQNLHTHIYKASERHRISYIIVSCRYSQQAIIPQD